jgi:hypothetical protein
MYVQPVSFEGCDLLEFVGRIEEICERIADAEDFGGVLAWHRGGLGRIFVMRLLSHARKCSDKEGCDRKLQSHGHVESSV